MSVYEIHQRTEDGYEDYPVLTFRADMAQSTSPVEVDYGGEWDATPFQVADGRHDTSRIAELLMAWMEGDWYSKERPVTVKEVGDG